MEVQTKREQAKAVGGTQRRSSLFRHKVWIGSYVLIMLLFVAFYFLLRLDVYHVFGTYQDTFQKIVLGGVFTFLILIITKLLEYIIAKKSHNISRRYNYVRLIRLIALLFIVGVFISLLFEHWYQAAVSLGLISLILGFALQTPISSFIGWMYVVIRAPYHVGDRIKIYEYTGDVVEIGYLDTTLWEFSGDYLSNDLPSGRLIRIPNSLVFQYAVLNYSWKEFPYIWNELPIHIAYESDLSYVEKTMREVATRELGESMTENMKKYKKLISQTPIDEVDLKEYPFVCFNTNANTWLEAELTYLVEPKEAAAVKSNLLKKILAEFMKEPDKVMFPKSNAR